MAATATFAFADPESLCIIVTGDGTVGPLVVANATILAAMVDGPLKRAWQRSYANQAAMRLALESGRWGAIDMKLLRSTGVVTTAQTCQQVLLIDTDAGGDATLAELNVGMSSVTGDVLLIMLRWVGDRSLYGR